MDAIPSLHATPRRCRPATGLLALLTAAGLCLGSAAHAAEPQPGAWQPHKLTLYFLGISTTYSCEGMKDALTYLLHQVGAKLEAPVVPQPCLRGYGTPEHLAQAALSFASLQPASGAAAGAANEQASVPGTWRHVELSSQGSPMLHGTDCELVNEFREEVLPLFATRDIKNGLRCIPFQEESLIYNLSFDVFVPVNAPPQD